MKAPPLDFRPCAGQRLILSEVFSEDAAKPQAQRHWYILGPWPDGEDMPAHVKAIILDVCEEAPEVLSIVRVDDNGQVSAYGPLVVIDDQGYLRHGVAYLTALVETDIGLTAAVVEGVHFEDEPTP
jgi:hypothetical protein